MTGFPVILRPEAFHDIPAIYFYILDITKDDAFAEAYVMRLRVRIRALSGFPRVGKRRDTLSPGLRSIRFERAYTIFYVVTESHVEITRILGSRQDHERILHRREEN